MDLRIVIHFFVTHKLKAALREGETNNSFCFAQSQHEAVVDQ